MSKKYEKLDIPKKFIYRRLTLTGNFKYLREFSSKIRNGPHGILRGPGMGPGENDSWKKHEVETLVSDSP
jgi:hypothetical protein